MNDTALVEAIGKRLNVDLDTVFTLTNVDGEFKNDDSLVRLIVLQLWKVSKLLIHVIDFVIAVIVLMARDHAKKMWNTVDQLVEG